jgi:hypothetical protein
MKMDVRIFKVTSGEQFIGEVVSDETNRDYLEVKNHCAVFPNQDGSNSIHVIKSYAMFDGDVRLYRNMIVLEGAPQEEILEQFMSAFSDDDAPENKILVPNKQLILS